MSELFAGLALPVLVLCGVGLALKAIGLGAGLLSFSAGFFVFLLVLGAAWEPISAAILAVMYWVAKVILAFVALVMVMGLARWISHRI